MTREADLAGSKQGLLGNQDASPASSHEDDSSGSELELDELDDHQARLSPVRMRGGWSPIKRKGKCKQDGPPKLPSKRKGGWLRNKVVWLILAILLGGMVSVLGGIYGKVFKKPGLRDGVGLPRQIR